MESSPVRPGTGRRGARLQALVVTAGLLTACGGQPCDDLPGLQAEREQRRAQQQELIGTDASDEQVGAADDRLHAFERRVFELEQRCERS